MEKLEKFILKETEKAVCVEARFFNYITEKERFYKIWVPKSCIVIDEKGFFIKDWFLRNKIEEIFGSRFAGSTSFEGLKIREEVA